MRVILPSRCSRRTKAAFQKGLAMMDSSTAHALLHLSEIAAGAGKHIRTTSHLKPVEAVLLLAEIMRLSRNADVARISRAA